MRSGFEVLAVSLCLVSAAACETQPSTSSFARSDSMRAQPVTFGRVVSVQSVTIRPGQTHLGMVTGAALGAIAGSQIGGGTASNVAGGIGGAVVGGVVGSAVQRATQTANGLEVTVTLDSGQTVAIIQPGDIRDFRTGDRVRVVGAEDNARVTR